MSIGEVLAALRPDFPDVTISKIRFLESEGLLEPERSPSGYRKFRPRDVDRLRSVLAAQRDSYLPLRVIKARLDAMDRATPVPQPSGPGTGQLAAVPEPVLDGDDIGTDPGGVRLTRRQLIATTGISEQLLSQLEGFGLVTSRGGAAPYDGDAELVARIVADLSRFGIEPRHLRAFRAAADREVGLIEQVVAPLRRQREPARGRADEVARELAAACLRLHATLVRSGLRS